MAEEEYQIRNKQMLIVAGGLGILAVLLVLWNEHRIRHENDEDMVDVVIAAKTITPDNHKKIALEDLGISKLPRRLVPGEFQEDIIQGKDRNAMIDFEPNQEITSGKIMRWSYLHGGTERSGQRNVPQVGRLIVPIAVDRGSCPPDIRPGSWVDLKVLDGTGAKTVMQGVLVKTVNGMGAIGSANRSIEAVGVEVLREDADKLLTFLERNRGRIRLLTCNESEPRTIQGFNPELERR